MRKRVKKIYLISLLLFFVFTKAYSADLTIVYPTNNTVVFNKTIHIVGYVKKSEEFTIKTNNKVEEIGNFRKLASKDGEKYVFMKSVTLDKDENDILVDYKGSQQNLKIFFKTSTVAYRDKVKKKTFFHMDENKTLCVSCHSFEKSADCMKCHKEKTKTKFVHGPVAAIQCFQCHDKNNYFTPTQPVSTKCLQCHQEFQSAMFEAKFAHGPTVAGYCNICHDPHGSELKFLLNDKINGICNNCHTDKKSGVHVLANFNSNAHPTSDKIIRSTGEELSCVSCHNPHYGKSKQLFQQDVTDFMELCLKCHNDKL
ncbi:cytochrome C [Deferribacteraceae bacterium V6Fe1]|nr:cytochrome C [Deferribacteraceae bacterium V6Fe1]